MTRGKAGPSEPLWGVQPQDESSLPMITSSAIELIDEAQDAQAIRIEEPVMSDPAERKFFDTSTASEQETQIGTSTGISSPGVRAYDLVSASGISSSGLSSSGEDPFVAAGVKPRHRMLPWLLFILSITGGVAAWLEVVQPRFEALRAAEQKIESSARELKDAQAKIGELEKKIGDLEAEKATLLAEREKLGLAAMEEQKKAREELADRLRTAFADEKRVEVAVLEDAVALRMTTDDIFVFGDVTLKDPALLDAVGLVLKGQGEHRFTIAAHTDATPVPSKLRARFPSNYELSAARAFAVLHQLETHKLGDRIEVIAAAETQPIASNKTQQGRRQNRRIEILIR